MRRITILIALIGLLFIPILTQAQTKRALVIGIGKQADSAWNKINGDKDVPYVLEILNAAKYEQIITCVNEEATKAGIVSAFQTLSITKEWAAAISQFELALPNLPIDWNNYMLYGIACANSRNNSYY